MSAQPERKMRFLELSIFSRTTGFAIALSLGWMTPVAVAQSSALSPLSQQATEQGGVGWLLVGIPKGKVPLADIAPVEQEGQRVLRLRTQASYGTWVHDVPRLQSTEATVLTWRWRLDEPVQSANLRTKAGDDAALKVCISFDMPTQGLSFSEAAVLKLARTATGEALPAATLCYVWDTELPTGTALANAYTKRVRFVVVNDGTTPLQQWQRHQRNVQKDFLQYFGHESTTVPPIVTVIVGADSDNTKQSSLGFVADVSLMR